MSQSFKGNSKIGRHAFTSVSTAVMGMGTGVVLDAIVSAFFGLGWQTDAYYISFTIPTVLITIMSLQSTRVVQALFIARKEKHGEEEAWRYLSLIMTAGLVVAVAICGVGVAISPLIIHAQALGTTAQELHLANLLSICLFCILPLYFPITVMRAAMQCFGIFGWSGAMKFFENCFKIGFLLLLGRKFGVKALIFGTFVSVICQIAIYYSILRKKGYRYRPAFSLTNPDVIYAGKLMLYPLAGQMCSVCVEGLNNTLCSALGAGNVTALRLGTRIIDSFAGLLPASIVIAAMPTVTASFAKNDMDGVKKNLQHVLYLLLLVTIPLSVWLGLMHQPLIAFLYQRQKFSAADTTLVSTIMLLMIPYMLMGRIWGMMELPFFAQHNTRTPLMGSVISAATYVTASLCLSHALGVYGIPVGRSLAYSISPFILWYLLHRKMGSIGFKSVLVPASKICVASAVMAGFILVGQRVTAAVPVTGLLRRTLAMGLPSLTGGVGLGISLLGFGLVDPAMFNKRAPIVGRWVARLTEFLQFSRTPL
ncbi:MAG TPA: lipid II flippase MurJ [Verrucomicrobiae bacterium]|jgi:putative peptidoglycan lipid II flippase